MKTLKFRHLVPMGLLALGLAAIAAPVALAEDWLQWGGPSGDFTVAAGALAESWPKEGPQQLWKRPLGEGYSAILHRRGQLFTMYREGADEVVIALDAATGKTLWRHRYEQQPWPEMGSHFGLGPNATPLIVGQRILTVSVAGQLRCLDLASGKLLWHRDLPAEYGRRRREEEWGYSASLLLYTGAPSGSHVIVQVGGDEHGVIALDPADGSVVWKSEPGGISYAQATLTRLAGRDHYVYFTPEGVAALDPSTGRTLWRSAIEYNNGNHLTPIVRCDDNHIWVASQFASGGGRLLKITAQGEALQAERLWFDQHLQASHWTSIRIGDLIYGSIGGNRVSFFAAFHWRTGKIAWRRRGIHKAQVLQADGKLLFVDEDGELTLARVSPERLEVLATAQVTESVSWTLPTLVSTTLYLRDTKSILALDLAEPKSLELKLEASNSGGDQVVE